MNKSLLVKKNMLVVVLGMLLLATPIFAFDLGKVLSDSIEKSVDDSVGKTFKRELDKALSSVMPKLGSRAKKDDGKGMDLSRGVTIFGYNGCPHCRKAYSYLKRNNIRYTLMDTQKNAKANRIANQKGIRGVPVIFVSGERFAGFSEGGYTRLFKKHGVIK